MDRRSTFIIAILVIIGLAFLGLALMLRGGVTPISESEPTLTYGESRDRDQTPPPPEQKTVITAKHAYRNGAHIIAGEMPLPTPCHLLETSGTASDDGKSVAFAFTSSIKTEEVCVQMITTARFRVDVKAAKTATMSATLNGQPVTLNLIEAGPDENLDDFELYIKG